MSEQFETFLTMARQMQFQDRLDPVAFLAELPTRQSIIAAMTRWDLIYHNISHAVEIGHIEFIESGSNWSFDDMLFHYLFSFYHDVVYIQGHKDNEEKSADRFVSDSYTLFSPQTRADYQPVIRDVEKAIRLSANHFQESAFSVNDRIARALDADLAGLAGAPSLFNLNSMKLRAEHAKLSDEAWREGRKNWLASVSGKRIFRTDVNGREARAQENIKNDLALMESGHGTILT